VIPRADIGRIEGGVAVTAETLATQEADHGFAFVQALAAELSAGRIDLPSFPDVVARIRQVLSDENVTAEQVSRVVGAEPALTARLLQLANSAAFNASGKRVMDLRTTIARLGFNMVTSAAIAFAMSELRKAEALKGLETLLRELWQRSAAVAAMSYVVARRCTKVDADTAMLAGLLHGVGELYLLTRATRFPGLFAEQAAYREIVRDWHASIAKGILENWDIAEDVAQAVELQDNLEYEHEGETDLTDVLIIAKLLVSNQQAPDAIEFNLQSIGAGRSLALDARSIWEVIQESASEMEALRMALGG
jgi:HD-like signal output (HDOD) protein